MTNFLILHLSMVITTTVFWQSLRPKKALWYIALTNKTIIRGNFITSTKHRWEKNWGKWNGEFWDRFQNRSPWQVWATFWPSKSVAVSENRNPELFNSDFLCMMKRFFPFLSLRSRYENATPNLCWVFCALSGVLCN